MTSLRLLDLSDNQFSGYFPSLIISNLTNIESLFLSRNELQGNISLCVFANLSRLSELDISFNHLEVETEMMSPSCFPSFKLSTLSLGGCNVKKISPWMLHNITLELWLSGNNLTGPFISNFQNITSKLTLLDISDNFLHGTLLEDINLNFPKLRHLDLSNNSFNGNLPIFFSGQLQMLDLSNNQFHGGIPYGMTSNMSCLVYLRLSGNNLTGDLFPKNSSLPNLRWLYLNNNHLSGTFPYALSKSMELGIIDIQKNDLSSELSSYLPVLPKLKILLLSGNWFEGKIPVQICQMKDLHILYLSENDLSGDIPHCVDNVTSWLDSSYGGYLPYDSWNNIEIMYKGLDLFFVCLLPYVKGIDVSYNRLRGKIPIQMTLLKGILFLNMSNNLLIGQIPSSLGNLINLESLDLSHNNFFGVLPHELAGLHFLEVFNVSFNNLSGMIPIEKQFETFESDSYLGNPNLCGHPLQIKCNDSAETPPIYAKEEKSVSIMYFAVLICPFFIVICLG
ncbi:receptor-like protein EIX2 [Gossypium arboreum]|nr:receptor-like protein EIX2 [Gossypium arboreum]